MKTTSAEQGQNRGRTGAGHVLPMFCVFSLHGNSMTNLFSYCGLVDARIRASEKDLPVPSITGGPRIVRILGHQGVVLLQKSY